MPDLVPCIIESPYAARKDIGDMFAKAKADYHVCTASNMVEATAAYNTTRMQVIEDMAKNKRYLKRLARHAIKIGFAPYASHGMYTHWLDDDIPHERALGIEMGLIWAKLAKHVLVGVDLGISAGMRLGLERHKAEGRQVIEVSLGPTWDKDAMVKFDHE